MTRHIALLRAINVGGRSAKKADLIPAFEEMGFTGVWTFLASGNVVFDAPVPPVSSRIAAGLEAALGFDVPVFLRTPAELFAVVDDDPFGGSGTRYVAFAHAPLDPGCVARLDAVGSAVDRFVARGRELHWRVDGGFLDSAFQGPALERIAGVPLTARKDTTLARIAKRLR